MTTRADVIVIGGGIVGLATARAIAEDQPGLDVIVLEKENEVGAHQTGHNSGVLHSGLYYRPGSLKARLCVEGRREMLAYCEARSIPVNVSGKIVIASHPGELAALDELERRGHANGLDGLERIGASDIAAIEPEAVGLAALVVPEAGVVDFATVARSLADELSVHTSQRVVRVEARTDTVRVVTPDQSYTARFVVNCSGLHSDRVARLAGVEPSVRIIPFRGEYYVLRRPELVSALIYPVPDPRFPFLGVHFTRRVDGTVEVGPNAVPALGREQYRGTPPDWSETRSMIGYRGLRRLAGRYWQTGLAELWRSRSRRRYAASAANLVPEVTADDLLPGGSGVRAQAVAPDGTLVDDFVFQEGPRSLHVLNAPSPAATASLAIGRAVAERAARQMV